jgi:hypothetical protein
VQQPLLVVVNSYRQVFRGSPTDTVAIAEQLGWLGRLAERGPAVVLIDQLNKPGASGAIRGAAAHADSSQKEYEADAVLHVERNRNEVGKGVGPARVYPGKRRAGEDGPPFVFDVVAAGAGAAPIWTGTTTIERDQANPPTVADQVLRVLALSRDPKTPSEIVQEIGMGMGSVKNALTQLKQEGRAAQSKRGSWVFRASSPSSPSADDEDDEDDDEAGGIDWVHPEVNFMPMTGPAPL